MNILGKAKSSIAVMLIMVLVACNAAAVTIAINIVAEAASAVFTTLGATGQVSPQVAAEVSTYAKQASQLVIDVNAELNNTADTKAQQWTKISGYFAVLVVPHIPGAPAGLAATISILETALVALEGALASQLGGSQPVKLSVKRSAKPAKLTAPVGKTMADAVATAQATLARAH